jgi:hypothetical protein
MKWASTTMVTWNVMSQKSEGNTSFEALYRTLDKGGSAKKKKSPKKTEKTLSQHLEELTSINRRIDNMRYLVKFKERDRDELIEEIRQKLGRKHPEYQPYTDQMASQDNIRIIMNDGQKYILSKSEADMLDLGITVLDKGHYDLGQTIQND